MSGQKFLQLISNLQLLAYKRYVFQLTVHLHMNAYFLVLLELFGHDYEQFSKCYAILDSTLNLN